MNDRYSLTLLSLIDTLKLPEGEARKLIAQVQRIEGMEIDEAPMQEQVLRMFNPWQVAVSIAKAKGIDNPIFDAELEASKAIEKWLKADPEQYLTPTHAWLSCLTYIYNSFRHYSDFKNGLRSTMRTWGDFAEETRACTIAETNAFTGLLESINRTLPEDVTPGTYLALLISKLPQGKQKEAIYLRMTQGKHIDESYRKAFSRGVQALRNMHERDLDSRDIVKLKALQKAHVKAMGRKARKAQTAKLNPWLNTNGVTDFGTVTVRTN